jgi:glutathione S-transferase
MSRRYRGAWGGGIDFPRVLPQDSGVGLERSRPAFPRRFAQALHFARSPGRGCWRNVMFPADPDPGGGLEQPMPVTVFGFPRSTYVKVVRLILTEKGVDYRFRDTEAEMYLPVHLERHPFGRVPALQHDDFVLYETSAIAAYIDEVFDGPKLTPQDPRKRARMNQWIGNLNAYFYPEMIYHVSHERLVYPELGIPGNDRIVQRAMPNVIRALEVMEQELADDRPFIVGDPLTMADFFLLPTLFAFGLTPEGKKLMPQFPAIERWNARMAALPSVIRFNASLPPRAPIEHAREWVKFHRPAA